MNNGIFLEERPRVKLDEAFTDPTKYYMHPDQYVEYTNGDDVLAHGDGRPGEVSVSRREVVLIEGPIKGNRFKIKKRSDNV